MKKTILIAYVVILLASCTAQHHHVINIPESAGFFVGLWHGMISPITFVISLFSDNVTVWETYNNGAWYTFGFLLGVGVFGCGSSKSIKS